MESMGYGNGTWVLGQNSSENSCNSCNLSTFRLAAIVRFDDEGLLSHICKPQTVTKHGGVLDLKLNWSLDP